MSAVPPFLSCTYESPIGLLTLCADNDALRGLWIQGQKYFGTLPMIPGDNAILERAAAWLNSYFDAENPRIDALPLRPEGSAFRRLVWDALCKIPYGEVVTYGDIAKALGRGREVCQAVGGAVGHNLISIIIPCHRVVGSNGCLTGYAGGLDKKRWLLEHEGAVTMAW